MLFQRKNVVVWGFFKPLFSDDLIIADLTFSFIESSWNTMLYHRVLKNVLPHLVYWFASNGRQNIKISDTIDVLNLSLSTMFVYFMYDSWNIGLCRFSLPCMAMCVFCMHYIHYHSRGWPLIPADFPCWLCWKPVLSLLLVPHAEERSFQSAAITFPFSNTSEKDTSTISYPLK